MKKSLPDTYSEVSDEDLLLRARMGDLVAYDVLFLRYASQRRFLCYCASPSIAAILDDWDINEAVFRAFYDAESSYTFGPVPFRVYFLKCLSNVMVNIAGKKTSKTTMMFSGSLDDPLDMREGSCCTLGDVVTLEGTLEDPRVFMNYSEMMMEYRRIPKSIHPVAVKILQARVDGYTLKEAAELIGIPVKKASYIFSRYLKWAKDLLNEYFGDPCKEE